MDEGLGGGRQCQRWCDARDWWLRLDVSTARGGQEGSGCIARDRGGPCALTALGETR